MDKKNKNIYFAFFSKKKQNKELEDLYNTYREQFVAYVKKNYTIEEDDIFDIYQDSFNELHIQIHSQKLTEDNLTASLRTYLFRIGINKLHNFLRSKNRFSEMPHDIDSEIDLSQEIQNAERSKIVMQEVERLGEPCHQILLLFYYARKNLKEIALIMGYASEQVAKNKRFSCTKLLKTRIESQYKKGDF